MRTCWFGSFIASVSAGAAALASGPRLRKASAAPSRTSGSLSFNAACKVSTEAMAGPGGAAGAGGVVTGAGLPAAGVVGAGAGITGVGSAVGAGVGVGCAAVGVGVG